MELFALARHSRARATSDARARGGKSSDIIFRVVTTARGMCEAPHEGAAGDGRDGTDGVSSSSAREDAACARGVEGEATRARRGAARLNSLGAVVRRTVVRVSMGTKPWATRAVARLKREWAEQFPSDDVWAAEMDRLDELAAFEAESLREALDEAEASTSEVAPGVDEGEVDAVAAAAEALTLVACDEDDDDAARECAVVDAHSSGDERDDDDSDVSCTPAKSTASFDEADYVYDDEAEDAEIKLSAGGHRVIVMPKALVLQEGVLPHSDAVSFVAPKDDRKPRTFWRNDAARRRDIVPVVRAPRSPISPEAPIPERAMTSAGDNVITHPDTPPWYQKRFDRETRELAKSARSLLDWAASATSEFLADGTPTLAPAHAATTHAGKLVQKTSYEPTWIDCGEDCLVVDLPVSNFIQLDKAD